MQHSGGARAEQLGASTSTEQTIKYIHEEELQPRREEAWSRIAAQCSETGGASLNPSAGSLAPRLRAVIHDELRHHLQNQV